MDELNFSYPKLLTKEQKKNTRNTSVGWHAHMSGSN